MAGVIDEAWLLLDELKVKMNNSATTVFKSLYRICIILNKN